jgi:HEPN domain-containing protein
VSDNIDRFIANTLRIAKEDLEAAKTLANAGSRSAAYHLEQAAEKILKAIVTSELVEPIPRKDQHNLSAFVAKIPDSNPLKPKCSDIADLSRYATSYRYTTSEGNIPKAPSANYVTDKINKISSLLTETAKRFEVDLDKQNTPAGKPDPIR